MDILLILALIWGYNNQPKDVETVAPVGTTFNQAVGFECESNCDPVTTNMVSTSTSTTVEEIMEELETMTDTTTVTATNTTTSTFTSTSTTTSTNS